MDYPILVRFGPSFSVLGGTCKVAAGPLDVSICTGLLLPAVKDSSRDRLLLPLTAALCGRFLPAGKQSLVMVMAAGVAYKTLFTQHAALTRICWLLAWQNCCICSRLLERKRHVQLAGLPQAGVHLPS